jgi:antitoxin CptB
MSPVLSISAQGAERLRRLRWRARRGMLENDIMLTRFLDRFEAELTEDDVGGLDQLLELTDNELLDLFLEKAELESSEVSNPLDTSGQRILQRIQQFSPNK